MAKMAKIVTVLVLGGLAVGGFAIAKKMIDEKKTSGGGGDTPTPGSVQYAEVTATNATLYDSGQPLVTLSAADKNAAIALVHERMKANGVSVYFIFTQATDGGWYATGYRDGASASDDMGPYADQALAMQAGTAWVQKAMAVPIPGAAVGARSTRRNTMGGGRVFAGPGMARTKERQRWVSVVLGGRTARMAVSRTADGFIRGAIPTAPGTNCEIGTPYDGNGQVYICCHGSPCIPLPITFGPLPSGVSSELSLAAVAGLERGGSCRVIAKGPAGQAYICCSDGGAETCVPLPIVFGPEP